MDQMNQAKSDNESIKKPLLEGDFKKYVTFEKRKEESERIRNKHQHRVPIIVEKTRNTTSIKDIDKYKYLVPNDLTLGQFIYALRKRTTLKPEEAMLVFINKQIVQNTALLSQVYNEHKDQDGFLYIVYSGESVFG